MKKFLLPILAVFSLVNSVSATSILSDNCDCSHSEDGKKLSRKLVNTTESINFIANTEKNLQNSIKFITEYDLKSKDESFFKEQNFVLNVGLMIDFMDENSEFYKPLKEIYSKLQSFSIKSSPTLTNEQKSDLEKLIAENYPLIIDVTSKINGDIKTHARKKCICKENLKNSLTDTEFDIKRADQYISDGELYNAYLQIESVCSSLKYMISESAPEYKILAALYDYLSSQSSLILKQNADQQNVSEAQDGSKDEYVKTYNEEKKTILEIIEKLKAALNAPEEPSEEEKLRDIYSELVAQHKSIGGKLQVIGEKLYTQVTPAI